MRIWVDADACPSVIKEILFRAAQRAHVMLTLVANQPLRIPPSPYIAMLQVPGGFDIADNAIAERTRAGDLVVTADVPLAARVIEKGGLALDPRGQLCTKENIKERLTMRHFMEGLRHSGIQTGGPSVLSQWDRQVFANALDRFLAKRLFPD